MGRIMLLLHIMAKPNTINFTCTLSELIATEAAIGIIKTAVVVLERKVLTNNVMRNIIIIIPAAFTGISEAMWLSSPVRLMP